MKEKIKFLKKADMVVIVVIIAIGIISWMTYNFVFSGKPNKAEIYYQSELIETIELDTGVEKTFSIPQKSQVIFHLYKDGSICFEQSDCPDKVCVHAGKLKTIGEYAACLPNGIILKIVPEESHSEDDLDIVVGK